MPGSSGAGHFLVSAVMNTWSHNLSSYYRSLEIPEIPKEYGCMNPYAQEETMRIVDVFLDAFYNDAEPRTLLFGINPGRFGSGITGISFTDPIRLKDVLGIDHPFSMRPELSSQFIYEVIAAFGGAEAFFSKFFVSAMYPLGFLHQGKNINYYEMKDWRANMLPKVEAELAKHIDWNVDRKKVISIGRGENTKVLESINEKHGWFDEVIALPHPRWILQYRRKRKDEFLDAYLQALY